MNEIKMLRRYIKSASKSIVQAFNDIPEDKRTWLPEGKSRSAVDIMNHMTYWNLSMVRAIQGKPVFEQWDDDWVAEQPELSDPAKSLELFESTMDKFREQIKAFKSKELDDKLTMPYGNETKYTIMLSNLVHNNYHWGQLMYIQRLLGDDREPA